MQTARVIGTLVATRKVKELEGYALKIIQPEKGEAVVAVDPIGARAGDHVLWVGKREASLAIPDAPLANNYPVDAAITGIIDEVAP